MGHGSVVLPEADLPEKAAVRQPEESSSGAVRSGQGEAHFTQVSDPSGRSAANRFRENGFRARMRSVQDSTNPPSPRWAGRRKVPVEIRGTGGPVTASRGPTSAVGPPRSTGRRRSGGTPGRRPSGRIPSARAVRPVGPTGRSLAGRRRGALTRSRRRARSDGMAGPGDRERRSETSSDERAGGPCQGFGAVRVARGRDSRSNRGIRGECGLRGRRGTHGEVRVRDASARKTVFGAGER